MEKLQKELQSFSTIWRGGYFNNIENDERNLMAIKEGCIDEYLTEQDVVLEIGCGRGAWTKHLSQKAKYTYCFDALSAQHNCFWEYIGENNKDKINYIHVSDFSCKDIPDNSISFLFSYDVFCHISYSGMTEYFKNLYPKLKSGAKCFVMVADYDKYSKFRTPTSEKVEDYDGEPSPGRWYWYGTKRFCAALRNLGYIVLNEDMDLIRRDPITFFTKL